MTAERSPHGEYVVVMIPSTALQDAVALLTVAMSRPADELDDLVAEFRDKTTSDELVLALVALGRSLCLATSRLISTLDESLTDQQALALTDDELFPVAMSIVRSYAVAAAENAQRRETT